MSKPRSPCEAVALHDPFTVEPPLNVSPKGASSWHYRRLHAQTRIGANAELGRNEHLLLVGEGLHANHDPRCVARDAWQLRGVSEDAAGIRAVIHLPTIAESRLHLRI